MLTYRDILASAKLIREIHGEGAEIYAASMIDAALEEGDPDKRNVWMAIYNNLKEIGSDDLLTDSQVHSHALELIGEHGGQDAGVQACARANAALMMGEKDTADFWYAVWRAIKNQETVH